MDWGKIASGVAKGLASQYSSTEDQVVRRAKQKIRAMSDSQLLSVYRSGSYDYRLEDTIKQEIRKRGL